MSDDGVLTVTTPSGVTRTTRPPGMRFPPSTDGLPPDRSGAPPSRTGPGELSDDEAPPF
jgi:hypothetical protein